MSVAPKYKAKKTTCGSGHLHDSKLEAGRCDDLVALERAGQITDLEQQPLYKVEINGVLICKYIADHRYRMADSGLQIVEDCKGLTTPVFNLKKKLVEATHPGVVITLYPPRKRKARKAKTK